MTIFRLTAVVAATLAMTGCGFLSGLDAKGSFSCKAPDGVYCESMTGIYANAEQNNLPGQLKGGKEGVVVKDGQAAQSDAKGVLTKPIYSGIPIRTAPRVLRVWFAPWEDSDGDLHDQSYVYLPVDNGRWLVEHNRRRIQDSYAPVRAPAVQQPAVAKSGPAVSGRSASQFDAPGPMEQIGAVQGRPSPAEAAALLGGIQTPGQFGRDAATPGQ